MYGPGGCPIRPRPDSQRIESHASKLHKLKAFDAYISWRREEAKKSGRQ